MFAEKLLCECDGVCQLARRRRDDDDDGRLWSFVALCDLFAHAHERTYIDQKKSSKQKTEEPPPPVDMDVMPATNVCDSLLTHK